MVIYRGIDGKPGYQQAEDIHDAVTFVEQMRNEEGVEQARIFRLEEVVFEYRPYYRVELSAGQHEPTIPPPAPGHLVVGGLGMAEVASETSAGVGHDLGRDLGRDLGHDLGRDLGDDEAFEVVESTTINVDDHEAEPVGGNGARRGLFGR